MVCFPTVQNIMYQYLLFFSIPACSPAMFVTHGGSRLIEAERDRLLGTIVNDQVEVVHIRKFIPVNYYPPYLDEGQLRNVLSRLPRRHSVQIPKRSIDLDLVNDSPVAVRGGRSLENMEIAIPSDKILLTREIFYRDLKVKEFGPSDTKLLEDIFYQFFEYDDWKLTHVQFHDQGIVSPYVALKRWEQIPQYLAGKQWANCNTVVFRLHKPFEYKGWNVHKVNGFVVHTKSDLLRYLSAGSYWGGEGLYTLLLQEPIPDIPHSGRNDRLTELVTTYNYQPHRYDLPPEDFKVLAELFPGRTSARLHTRKESSSCRPSQTLQPLP